MIGWDAAPRYAELIKRLTGQDGILPPGITLESDRLEWSFLKRERLAWTVGAIGPIAAQFSRITIVSPKLIAGKPSNILAYDFWILANVAAHIFVDNGVASTALCFVRDSRWDWANQSPVLKKAQDTAAAIGGFGPVSQLQTGFWNRIPAVLSPGHDIFVASDVVNIALETTILWTERGALPEELAI